MSNPDCAEMELQLATVAEMEKQKTPNVIHSANGKNVGDEEKEEDFAIFRESPPQGRYPL